LIEFTEDAPKEVMIPEQPLMQGHMMRHELHPEQLPQQCRALNWWPISWAEVATRCVNERPNERDSTRLYWLSKTHADGVAAMPRQSASERPVKSWATSRRMNDSGDVRHVDENWLSRLTQRLEV
jgi:hypothetical protein